MNWRLYLLKLLVLSSALLSHHLHAEPYIPANDSVVLETLPTLENPQIKKLRTLRKQLSQKPKDLALSVSLARAYLQLGRRKADPRYDGYAQNVLEFWWAQPAPPPDVLILRATLRQRRHQFAEALRDLSQVLQADPNHAQAWLTQSVIHQVQGDYQAARRSCLPLLRLTHTLVSTACIANVTGLNGQAERSYQSLQEILTHDISATPEEKLWALTLMAELASRIGQVPEAEEHFLKALGLDQDDTYLLGAYSDFLLDQGRAADVQSLLKQHIKSDALLLRLALAEQQLNTATLTQHVRTLQARFRENRLRGDSRHLREEARFTLHLLHEPQKALRLAQKNWSLQREPWDARILLEAALQSHNHEAAQSVIHFIRSNHTEDINLETLIRQLT